MRVVLRAPARSRLGAALASALRAHTGLVLTIVDDRTLPIADADLIVSLVPPDQVLIDAAGATPIVWVGFEGGNARPGLASIATRAPTSGFRICLRDSTGERTIARGSIWTNLFHHRNRRALEDRAGVYLARAVANLARGADLPDLPLGAPETGRPRTDVLRYLRVVSHRIAIKARRRLHGRRWRWNVALSARGWREVDPDSAVVVPNPPGGYLADPFLLDHAGTRHLFVEEYRFDTKKGVIACYRVDGDLRCERVGIALETDFHLSFPFVFVREGIAYMLPETLAAGDIRLYRCIDFPLRWELAGVLMPGVSAVDTILFEHEERWWLLTNLRSTASGLNDAELHAFSSPSPLTFGGWTPHPANPIRNDAAIGRNGGIVLDDGKVFRVAQHPAFDHYGHHVSVRRIDRLEPDYVETPVREIAPDSIKGVRGIHHLSNIDDVVAFDFLRIEREDRNG